MKQIFNTVLNELKNSLNISINKYDRFIYSTHYYNNKIVVYTYYNNSEVDRDLESRNIVPIRKIHNCFGFHRLDSQPYYYEENPLSDISYIRKMTL